MELNQLKSLISEHVNALGYELVEFAYGQDILTIDRKSTRLNSSH